MGVMVMGRAPLGEEARGGRRAIGRCVLSHVREATTNEASGEGVGCRGLRVNKRLLDGCMTGA
jgi:hypothetical protein